MPTAAADYLSVEQTAAALEVSPRTVRRWIHAGTLTAIKMGPGTAPYFVARDDIERKRSERAA
jgi:excisionase family DNA binding protein